MVKVNGELLDMKGRTVSELLEEKGFDPLKTAVELNEDIVPKAQYSTAVLKDGDSVEVVSFVGGG